MEIADLILQVRKYNPEAEVEIIQQAYEKAKKSHQGQMRASGEAFIIHPLSVACLLAELRMDTITIVSGLLHDVVEDTHLNTSDIKQEFGDKAAELVEGVSKISKLTHISQQHQQAESLRKMLLATAKDVRIILIKICDRLHNMQTIDYMPQSDQMRIARETLDIYAPLANSLGMGRLRWELEDLSFACIQKEAYQDLKKRIADKWEEREAYLEKMKKALEEELSNAGIPFSIVTRPKHFYSIYQKMKKYNKPLDEIYDLLGLRVITKSLKDCYGILGFVHSLWRPVPGRFKDYIGNPKSNLYQSLHTTVIGFEGKPMEVQIRTQEMDVIAEEGIAAHWRYKAGKEKKVDEEFYAKLTWLKRIIDWEKDSSDPKEFLESLKLDLFEDTVFVFTPRGEVKELPSGSTPIDFAYSVHSQVGDHCFGAKVNDKIVPLDYQLKSGDRVDIITSSKVHPNHNWLRTVKTPKARNRIKHWLYQLEEEEKPKSTPAHEPAKEEEKPAALHLPLPKKHKPSLDDGVGVVGAEGLTIHLSKCCQPVPGDKIIGLISRSHGVAVHRQDCSNIQDFDLNQRIEVYWKNKAVQGYEVNLLAIGLDRKNLLADMLSAIGGSQVNISAAWGKTQPDGNARCGFTITTKDTTQLQAVFKQLEKVSGVLEVYRA